MAKLALEVVGLQAWHDGFQILHGIHFNAAAGEAITLLGRNGSGRTTTLRALQGLTGKRAGSILIHGTESIHLPTSKIAHLGMGYCPESRDIFTGLTCEENLLLPPSTEDTLGGGMSLAEIYELFPYLEERRHLPGSHFSRGEQQMLAIARILRTGANILLLDAVSEGLAPVVVHALAHMITVLKEQGYTIVMVDQSPHFSASLASRFYLIENGTVATQLNSSDLPAHQDALNSMLGVV